MLALMLLGDVVFPPPVYAQAGSTLPCSQREAWVNIPTADLSTYCIERVIGLNNAPELSFTALATLPDGRLFTTAPAEGTLIEITDTNSDLIPDTPVTRADGLERPVSLTAFQEALYITGGSTVYRWTEASGIETLVSDLPTGTGYWNGGIAVGGEADAHRLYVGLGARCDLCEEARGDTERGVILSFALDGSDRQLIATGFRQPSGMMWHQGSLWVTDIAPRQITTGRYDELNQIILQPVAEHASASASVAEPAPQVPDYGAPFCMGDSTTIDSMHTCDGTVAPFMTFSSGSNPIALARYQGAAFASNSGYFTIAFSGTAHASRLRGYTVEFYTPDGETSMTLVPSLPDRDQQYGGIGFYPHHIYGVTLSPEGWIYLSAGGGSIYVIRPAWPDALPQS